MDGLTHLLTTSKAQTPSGEPVTVEDASYHLHNQYAVVRVRVGKRTENVFIDVRSAIRKAVEEAVVRSNQ